MYREYYSRVTSQDITKAARSWALAAQRGNAYALRNLGICYYLGEGVEKNLEEAARLFFLAAEKGDAFSQTSLGACYYHGEGVERNLEEAIRLFSLAAEKGDVTAQKNLGICYDEGIGVKQDKAKGLKFLFQSAAQRNKVSLEKLENNQSRTVREVLYPLASAYSLISRYSQDRARLTPEDVSKIIDPLLPQIQKQWDYTP